METLTDTLRERVDELTSSGRGRETLLSTTGVQAAIAELIARTAGLEQAVREIALEVERLAQSQQSTSSDDMAHAGERSA